VSPQPETTVEQSEARRLVESYLAALEANDVERCVDFYHDDAAIHFQAGIFRGRKQIEEWHRARFEAGMRIVTVEDIRVDGDQVVVDGVATSNRLKTWRIGSLSGTVSFRIEAGKVREAKFGMRIYNPLEGW
jgi:ketosteroid isomerase-like protein